ncbi:unnamed protein product, partial [Prorocentrum cordatum]
RLSTLTFRAAAALAARIESTAPGSQPSRVALVAAPTAPAWMWRLRANLEECAMSQYSARSLHRYQEPEHGPARAGRKWRIRTHLTEAVDPRLAKVELGWRTREAAIYPSRGDGTAIQAATTTSARARAQLRLQGRLAVISRDGLHPLEGCRHAEAAARELGAPQPGRPVAAAAGWPARWACATGRRAAG